MLCSQTNVWISYNKEAAKSAINSNFYVKKVSYISRDHLLAQWRFRDLTLTLGLCLTARWRVRSRELCSWSFVQQVFNLCFASTRSSYTCRGFTAWSPSPQQEAVLLSFLLPTWQVHPLTMQLIQEIWMVWILFMEGQEWRAHYLQGCAKALEKDATKLC